MEVSTDKIQMIARVCHEANAAYCAFIGDSSQPSWKDAPGWQRESAVTGVCERMKGLDAPPSNSHESWLRQKEKDGWVYGEKKDADAKTHPCMVPYGDLPTDQAVKDHLFCAICRALVPLL